MGDNKKEIERANLHNTIWKIADELRGSIDGWDFKQYVLGFLFYRFISENICRYINDYESKCEDPQFEDYAQLNDSYITDDWKKAVVDEKGFFIMPSQLFTNVNKCAQDDANLNETLQNVFRNIEESAIGTMSEEDLKGLFNDIDPNSSRLGNTVAERNKKLATILNKIGSLNLGNYEDNTIDVFGDAYEYLMSMYAKGAGKSGGEFFTPQEVSELLAQLTLINFNSENKEFKNQVNKVYDPCCGSGSLLLKFAKFLGEENVGLFCGQEINLTTYNLARINMFLHNINFNKFAIRLGNTLTNPRHLDEKPFEAIVSNPPYSISWDGDSNPLFANDERFLVTRLAPKSKADLAFILHMVNHLATNGTAAVVMFPGTLYRGGAERDIREYLVRNINVVDAIIQLPENLFFGPTISTCIWVLRKNKSDTNVFFVDASNEFIKVTNKNKLTNDNINKIVDTVRFKKEIEHFSKIVNQSEIIDNNFNLSVGSYVEKEDTSEKIDIKVLNNQIKETVSKIDKLRNEIDEIVKMLGD